MPLWIERSDLTKMRVDAIVNAANETLLGGGGLDGSIHRAAGPKLLAACKRLGGCKTGSAKLTKGYDLPAKYVIHAVGSMWQGGGCGEREALISCYRTTLTLAQEYGCETVAFPLISSGLFGYPKDEALDIAVKTIEEFLEQYEMTVYLVVFDKQAYQLSRERYDGVAAYIDDHYTDALIQSESYSVTRRIAAEYPPKTMAAVAAPSFAAGKRLNELAAQLDESFTEMLLRKIDERGMTDAACYKKANVDRKLFSKIRSDKHYQPSKPTVLAFAIALELPLDEVKELLQKAGFALSHSSLSDVIVEYFVQNQNYNIHEINEALFAFDQRLLGI